jgi:hypothetical protein
MPVLSFVCPILLDLSGIVVPCDFHRTQAHPPRQGLSAGRSGSKKKEKKEEKNIFKSMNPGKTLE